MIKKEYILINFCEIWKENRYKITNKEKRIFNKGIKFYYKEKTTVRDLLLFFNKVFKKINKKQDDVKYNAINEDANLKYLYRLVYKNNLIYLFDLKMKIKVLVNIIRSKQLTFLLTIFVEKGGTILNIKGMRFFFHSKENGKHHLPHIHVSYNEYEVVVSLDGNVLDGYLPNKKLKVVRQIIENNKESLLLKWNALTDGEKFEFKNNELIRTF